MIPSILPPLSASSKITPIRGGAPKYFNFQFSIHPPSGALLLVPENDHGLLEAVRNAKHREPEEHLEAASDLIIKALKQSQTSNAHWSVLGITNKDQSLVNHLCQKLETASPGLVLLPESHTLEAQDIIYRSPSKFICEPRSILIVRHLLEHARGMELFLHGLRNMLGNESICLIEVPDSAGLITKGDLTQLWEEHTAYFTQDSFQRALCFSGFDILAHQKLISDGEELCLAVVRRSEPYVYEKTENSTDTLVVKFLDRLPKQLLRINTAIARISTQRAIYIFGANHIAGIFLDLIADGALHIYMVIDDDPEKAVHSLGLHCTPIGPLGSIDRRRPAHLLVAVNQGRAPELYERLSILFPETDGHRVESLVSLALKCW